jgi:hypothetical protein
VLNPMYSRLAFIETRKLIPTRKTADAKVVADVNKTTERYISLLLTRYSKSMGVSDKNCLLKSIIV